MIEQRPHRSTRRRATPPARLEVAWPTQARCAQPDADPELWFDRRREDEAVAECRRCPVIDPCRRAALEPGERDGVWGGLTERQLRRRRRSPPLHTPEPAAHGTPRRYRQGCTTGIDGAACDLCKRAWARYKRARRSQGKRVG